MERFYKLIDNLLGIMMGLMVLLVFFNVVLRFVFNTGITWSEELSRFIFVFTTYIGAIVAMRTSSHLGMDIAIRKMPYRAKIVSYTLAQTLIAVLMVMLGHGALKMVIQSTGARAAATGIPLSVMYGLGIVTAVFIIAYAVGNIYKVIKNPQSIGEMVATHEVEEDEAIEETEPRRVAN